MAQHPNPPARRHFRSDAGRPLALLARCPAHEPTPLVPSTALAAELGLADLWLKDEGARMGLGSFKALGGIFAIATLLMDLAGSDDPTSSAARTAAARTTLIAASAGNHGLSVATGARHFGARAVIVLDEGVDEGFADRIRATGATVHRVSGSYDDAVAAAGALAEANGWTLLADGSWTGYTTRPALVVEGYTVLAQELTEAFGAAGHWPDLLVLQAGVGGLAAAVAAHVRDTWPNRPRIVVVEPRAAPCLRDSVAAGRPVRVEGPVSAMGRLDCKEPSLIALQALSRDADDFVTVSEAAAARAVQTLARHGIATTPSGAAGLAALAEGLAGAGPETTALAIVSERAVQGKSGPDGHARAGATLPTGTVRP